MDQFGWMAQEKIQLELKERMGEVTLGVQVDRVRASWVGEEVVGTLGVLKYLAIVE